MKLYFIIHLEKNIISWDIIVKLNTLFWNCLTIRAPYKLTIGTYGLSMFVKLISIMLYVTKCFLLLLISEKQHCRTDDLKGLQDTFCGFIFQHVFRQWVQQQLQILLSRQRQTTWFASFASSTKVISCKFVIQVVYCRLMSTIKWISQFLTEVITASIKPAVPAKDAVLICVTSHTLKFCV